MGTSTIEKKKSEKNNVVKKKIEEKVNIEVQKRSERKVNNKEKDLIHLPSNLSETEAKMTEKSLTPLVTEIKKSGKKSTIPPNINKPTTKKKSKIISVTEVKEI